MKTIGERVIELREARGWNQTELAKEAGIGQSTLAGIETGARNKAPSSLIEVAHALGVDAYWLKTGLGNRSSVQNLTADEKTVVEGFRLLGDEMRESWLDQARKKIDIANSAKNKAA